MGDDKWSDVRPLLADQLSGRTPHTGKTIDLFAEAVLSQLPSAGRYEHDVSEAMTTAELETAVEEMAVSMGMPRQHAKEMLENPIKAFSQLLGSGAMSFQQPHGFGYALAKGYVNRGNIWRRRVKPVLIAGGIVALLGGGIYGGWSLKDRAGERIAEAKIASAMHDRTDLLARLDAKPGHDRAAADGKYRHAVDLARGALAETDTFFSQYGTEDNVTRANYRDVRADLRDVEDDIVQAGLHADEAQAIVDYYFGLDRAKESLDTVMEAVRGMQGNPTLKQRAEHAYEAGTAAIMTGDLTAGKAKEHELIRLKEQIQLFRMLPQSAKASYDDIVDVSRVPSATAQATRWYSDARKQTEAVDVDGLQATVANLQDLEYRLEADIVLRVVDREGEKTGTDREYEGEDGWMTSGFYIIVEAVDRRTGNTVMWPVTSEETQVTERVSMWGERVPEDEFERWKDDKVMHGHVSVDDMGYKQRGYLEVQLTDHDGMRIERTGQITEW